MTATKTNVNLDLSPLTNIITKLENFRKEETDGVESLAEELEKLEKSTIPSLWKNFGEEFDENKFNSKEQWIHILLTTRTRNIIAWLENECFNLLDRQREGV